MASDYTTNFNLDKYVGTDKPNLRDQYNSAMDKIDAQLKISSDNAALAVQTANNASSAVSNFDSRIDELEDTVTPFTSSSTIKSYIDSHDTSVENNAKSYTDTQLANLEQTEAFFFGDSWGVSATSESDPTTGNALVTTLADLCQLNINNYCVRGSGFVQAGVDGNTMIQKLNTVNVTTEKARKTKYVFVCAGTNDGEQSQSSVGSAASSYFTALAAKFPYSEIIFTPNFRKIKGALDSTRMGIYYTLTSVTSKKVHVNTAIAWLPFINWWASDGIHLTSDGYATFARMIHNNLLANSQAIWPVTVGPYTNSPVSINNISSCYYNGVVHIRGKVTATRDFSSAQNMLVLGSSLDPNIFPDITTPFLVCTESGTPVGSIRVTSGGNIQICPSQQIANGTVLEFNITYLTTCYAY